MRAALRGVKEVGFTVLAMSLSLVAVFIPMLLMGGLSGRLFREFAVTLSVSIMVSLVLSVTLTPMMCACLLRSKVHKPRSAGMLTRAFQAMGSQFCGRLQAFAGLVAGAFGRIMMLLLVATIGLNFYLYAVVPKGFFPQQDTGQLLGFSGATKALRSTPCCPSSTGSANLAARSGGAKRQRLRRRARRQQFQFHADPAEAHGRTQCQRQRCGESLAQPVPWRAGRAPDLVPQQDICVGDAQSSSGSYEYTMKGSDLALLQTWLPKVQRALAAMPELTDVDTDVEDKGTRVELVIDRDAATRLGVDMSMIASVLNNSFSQRQVSVIYGPLNQYHVVMGVDEQYAQDAESLKRVEVVTADGGRVPLSAFTRFEIGSAPLRVYHEGLFAAESVSFSLAPGVSLDQATSAIDQAVARIGLPTQQIQAGFVGTAQALQESMSQQPWLILAALVTMYIVLGILYESYVHPHHHPVDAAIGRYRRLAGADPAGRRVHADRLDRCVPAYRYRQEERHHDGGLCLAGRAPRRAFFARCDLSGLPGALPSHHDDHGFGLVRRAAAGAGFGRRRRNAQASGPDHRGRPDPEPDSYAIHDAGGLSVPGSFPLMGQSQARRFQAKARSRLKGILHT